MARMLPPICTTKSPGEKLIFDQLKADPQTRDWIVLHSLDIANHPHKRVAEADFVIIIPGRGVLVLEVKAHTFIERKEGEWFLGSEGKKPSPFVQAKDAMFAIQEHLQHAVPASRGMVMWFAVSFPRVDFSGPVGDEWHPWQLIDQRRWQQQGVGAFAAVLEQAREHIASKRQRVFAPDSELCGHVLSALRPEFELYESPKARMQRIESEVKRYTEEQYNALDAMEDNERIIFSGPAGTGKTLLAIEAARRSAAAGRRVLFLCFNRLLYLRLREELAALEPQVACMTFHKYMVDVSGAVPPKGEAGENWWGETLPLAALEALMARESEPEYDEIIIDEVQDLVDSTYLDILDLSVRGGLARGRWRWFGDGAHQAIYTANSLDEQIAERGLMAVRYRLRINCRNSPQVAALIERIAAQSGIYQQVRRQDDDIAPEVVYYDEASEQGALLVAKLAELYGQGLQGEDIIVLSHKRDALAAAAEVREAPWSQRIKPLRERVAGNYVRYATIHAFKGLERHAVIITDIDDLSTAEARMLVYTGASRALQKLIILAQRPLRSVLK